MGLCVAKQHVAAETKENTEPLDPCEAVTEALDKRISTWGKEDLLVVKKTLVDTLWEVHGIELNDDLARDWVEFAKLSWQWDTQCEHYQIDETLQSISNHTTENSNWGNWCVAKPAFGQCGNDQISIRIDHKKESSGWIAIGVVRKSHIDSNPEKGG